MRSDRPRISFLAFLFVLVPLCSFGLRIVPQTGLHSTVTDIAWQESGHRLITGGEDGNVSVWSVPGFELLETFQVSSRAVRTVRVHPTLPLVAAVVSDNMNSVRLVVIDIAEAREVYAVELDDAPTHVDFSPQGTYLAYSLATIDGFRLLDAGTGAIVPAFAGSAGIGMMTYFAFSRSEQNLLAYHPTGRIVYYRVQTGQELQSASAPSSLSHFFLSPDRRSLVATSDRQIHVLDAVTGRSLVRRPSDPILDLAVSEDFSRVAVLTQNASVITLQLLSLSNGRIDALPGIFQSQAPSLTSATPGAVSAVVAAELATGSRLVFCAGALYGSGENDEIFRFSFSGQADTPPYYESCAASRNREFGSVVASGRTLFLGVAGEILALEGDFLSQTNASSFAPSAGYGSSGYGTTASSPAAIVLPPDLLNATGLSMESIQLPFEGTPGLWLLSEDRLLVWEESSVSGPFYVYGISDQSLEETTLSHDSRVRQVLDFEDNFLILETSGSIRIIDPVALDTRFSFQDSSILSVTPYAPGPNFLAGRSPLTGLLSALLQINTRTGETLPLSVEVAAVVLDLCYLPFSRSLYILHPGSLDTEGNSTTVLSFAEGPNFSSFRTIMIVAGERLDSFLVPDNAQGVLYTNLYRTGIQRIRRNSILPFDNSVTGGLLARTTVDRMFIRNPHLFLVNSDGSLTMRSSVDGTDFLDFCVFEDGCLIAIDKQDGRFWSSDPRGSAFVRVADDTGRTIDGANALPLLSTIGTSSTMNH